LMAAPPAKTAAAAINTAAVAPVAGE
jgi:hypothetical protein